MFISKLKSSFVRAIECIIVKNILFFLKLYRLILTLNIKNKLIVQDNVTLINTFDTGGGAAKIAGQLSLNLQKYFITRFYVKTKKSNNEWVFEIQPIDYNFFEELLRREAVKKGWIEYSGFHALSLLDDSFFMNSSIVHIHNLHGEFFSPVLFKSLFQGKKVIWTLHDESFITGHCSCTLGCDRWQKGCGFCPDLTIYPPVNFDNTKDVLRFKKKWISALKPIVVCPSYWLASRVRFAYPDLKNIEVIPNGVDTDIFFPKDKLKMRELLGLPLDKKIVLFVAEFATLNPFKGGAILREVISDSTFSEVIFITVGGKNESSFLNHICYPYIDDENELSNLYAACDVLLYPTQADNLPLVVLESMACGTPVIASQLGGIPEIINDSNGVLINDYKNSFAFKDGLLNFLTIPDLMIRDMRNSALLTIKEQYSLSQMITSYKSLYVS